MNILERLLGAGAANGLERRSPAAQADQPAVPMTTTQTRDGYVSTSLSQLSRIPRELVRNVGEIASNWGETAATIGTGMLPGAGTVEAPRNYAAGNEAFAQGDYLRGAGQYAMGIYNQATDFIPGTPTLAHGLVPAAGLSRAAQLQDVARQYDRPQTGQQGQTTAYSKIKHEIPFEDMTRRVIDDPNAPLVPWQEADLQKMVGGYGIPLVGDRTEAGKLLTHINGQRLPWHTKLEGGYQYPQSAASVGPDQAGWASHANPITTLSNRVAKAQKAIGDAPLYGIYSGMAERSGDFSTMNADALLGLVHAGNGIDPAGMRGFDELLKARLQKDGLDAASWPGLSNAEKARELLSARPSGDLRKAFVETADSGAARQLGLPDVAAVRKATTAPHLLDWNGSGASGGSIVRFGQGGRPITDPAIPHGTYPHQYPAEYVGGLDVNLDRNELFPRTSSGQFAIPQNSGAGREWRHVDRAFMTNAGLLEKFDNEWLDTAMSALERRRANGR